MVELIRPVDDFPGYYVDRTGRVYSMRSNWAELSGGIGRKGYRLVVLMRDGVCHNARVHQIVCRAWNGPRKPGQMVRHLNGDRRDNRPENLAWGTAKDNASDAIRHGTMPRGEKNGNALLTEAAVRELRSTWVLWQSSLSVAAKKYGVSEPTITSALSGRTWKHVNVKPVCRKTLK